MAYNPKIVKDVPASMGLTESTLYPLLIAFFAVAVTVYICIWVLALCAWIVTVAFGGAGAVFLAFAAPGIAIGHVPYVIATLGAGLAFIGVGLFAGAGAWAVSKQIVRLSALWARKAVSPFWKNASKRSHEGAPNIAHLAD